MTKLAAATMAALAAMLLAFSNPSPSQAAVIHVYDRAGCVSECGVVLQLAEPKERRALPQRSKKTKAAKSPRGRAEAARAKKSAKAKAGRKLEGSAARERPRAGPQPRQDSAGASPLVQEARKDVGRNPGGWRYATLWCAEYINRVLARLGLQGTGSAAAASFAGYGTKVKGPQVGAIAVMYRKGGNHVGIVSRVAGNGDPVVISGNGGKTRVKGKLVRIVTERPYPRSRVYAYVVPLEKKSGVSVSAGP